MREREGYRERGKRENLKQIPYWAQSKIGAGSHDPEFFFFFLNDPEFLTWAETKSGHSIDWARAPKEDSWYLKII